jgi:hypothetical protein
MLSEISNGEFVGVEVDEDVCGWVTGAECHAKDGNNLVAIRIGLLQKGLTTPCLVVRGGASGRTGDKEFPGCAAGERGMVWKLG